MRNVFKRAVLAGLIVGALYAIARAIRARMPASTSDLRWERAPFPFPPVPRPGPVVTESTESAGPAAGGADAWIEPVDGECPATHPVKAKMSSGIFHVPGGQNYERTHPDRCYADADAAESDGLRRSQR